MIISVKTLVFCEKMYEYGDVHEMVLPFMSNLDPEQNVQQTTLVNLIKRFNPRPVQ